MRRWVVIGSLLMLLSASWQLVSGQDRVAISGQVFDAASGEFLIGASVIDANTGKGTSTNSYGFFSLIVRTNLEVQIVVSFVGYTTKYIPIQLQSDTIFQVFLESAKIELEDVTVTYGNTIHEEVQMSISSLRTTQVENLPALGGETDLLKAYQLMPGIAPGHEGSSDYFVRGGGHDQNLILMDDVPLYYINHIGGFVSIFNPDIIKDSRLIKGAFPARYGNRLSSVLDVRMKDGNTNAFEGKGTIGMLTSKLYLEGPLSNGNTSFLFSARRFMWDVFYLMPLSAILSEGDMVVGYGFYDLNAKIKHRLSDSDIVFASFYSGDDKLRQNFFDEKAYRAKATRNWGNLLGTIRWNHLFNTRLFSNTTISYTRFRYNSALESTIQEDEEELFQSESVYSGIRDLNSKIDLEYTPVEIYQIIMGAGISWHHFEPGVTTFREIENEITLKDTMFNEQKLQSFESFIYVENMLDIGTNLAVNLGFRLSGYFLHHQHYLSFEPRLSGRYLLGNQLSFKFAYARMNQNIHLLDYPNFGLKNTDLWIPTMDGIKPEQSNQYSMGAAWALQGDVYEFTIEGYKKDMENLIALKHGSGFATGINWQDNLLQSGTGNAYGLEIMTQKKQGQVSGWISYTYSRSFRQFDELNHGEEFVFKYDRPHSVSLNVSYQPTKNISFSLVWVYQTGMPITFSDGYVQSPDFNYYPTYSPLSLNTPSTIKTYSAINNFRMRDYHRLDLGVQFRKEKTRGVRTWNLSIYNAYNRQNPYYYFWKTLEEDGKSVQKLYQRCLFPILPSVSYEFEL
ncbi:MAG: TonB-dependent receptor [Bacteroidales bacterium]|nr:TonB-dependent receptor [Bacteroidales bacterium]MDT8432566.1 TonB-dependent receptor [Bacteroidales bacterium]